MEEEILHLMVNMEQRRRKVWKPGITFKGTPPVTYFLQVGPPLKVSRASQSNYQLRIKLSAPESVGDISYSNQNTFLSKKEEKVFQCELLIEYSFVFSYSLM
jgi:hypothetical protein